jgi:hypothetical protein
VRAQSTDVIDTVPDKSKNGKEIVPDKIEIIQKHTKKH